MSFFEIQIYSAIFNSAKKLANGYSGKQISTPCVCNKDNSALVRAINTSADILGDRFSVYYESGCLIVRLNCFTFQFLSELE